MKKQSSSTAIEDLKLGFNTDDLLRLARWRMPFGKYQGRALIDLPEAYLLWFEKHEFPAGRLGELMKLSLMLKIDGLDRLLKPLVTQQGENEE